MTQALLLMDLQQDVLQRHGASGDYIDRVLAVQRRALDAGLLVVLVQVAFRPGHPEVAPTNGGFSAVKSADRLVLGAPGTGIDDAIARDPRQVVVTKRRISAFAGSDLSYVLAGHGATHLVLAGIASSGVVLSTVREASDRDYRLTVLEDCCLDNDPEVHRVLMERVFPRQADVVDSTEWRP